MNTNTKGTLLAIGIMAVIIVLGIMYGVQLEKSFYISNTY
jgi:ABC-type lipoprotein release transport system permease subunit